MPIKKMLAIGAHPDDVDFGCGGLLLKHAQRGIETTILVCSRGESSSHGTPAQRAGEARRAATLLQSKIVFKPLGRDGSLIATPAAIQTIAREIRRLKPDYIITHAGDENQHPDHVQVARIVRAAARIARYGGIKGLGSLKPHSIQSLWSFSPIGAWSRQPDVVIDISDVVKPWQQAMAAHQSQHATRPYSDLLMAKARVYGLLAGVAYAQDLYCDDPLILDDLNSVKGSLRQF